MTTESGPGPGRPDPGLSAIGARRHLIDLAYRLLGSLAEAEDAVQETYARWYAMSRQQQQAIASPGAWLTTVASRICLDLLGSARARRERYVGPWIPEPLPDPAEWAGGRPGDAAADPADRVTLDESVAMAFLVVLESMTPAERVAFILHDVFGYPFADIAAIAGRSPAACRQLASARRRIRASQAPAAPPAQQASIVRDFKKAWEASDIDALIRLLDPAATVIGDGGGLVRAVLCPIEGGEQIARFFVDLAGRMPSTVAFLERTVNGQPGLVLQHDGVIVTVFAFGVAGDRVRHIWVVRNPENSGPGRRADARLATIGSAESHRHPVSSALPGEPGHHGSAGERGQPAAASCSNHWPDRTSHPSRGPRPPAARRSLTRRRRDSDITEMPPPECEAGTPPDIPAGCVVRTTENSIPADHTSPGSIVRIDKAPPRGQEGKAAMSEHTGPADAGPVTLINVFEIPAEQVDAFIEAWAERARIMTTHPGFRDTLLHRALSPEGRFQLVNVAHWDSAESTAAAHADPEWQASRAGLAQLAPRAVANQQLYQVVAGYAMPPGADEPLPVGQGPAG